MWSDAVSQLETFCVLLQHYYSVANDYDLAIWIDMTSLHLKNEVRNC